MPERSRGKTGRRGANRAFEYGRRGASRAFRRGRRGANRQSSRAVASATEQPASKRKHIAWVVTTLTAAVITASAGYFVKWGLDRATAPDPAPPDRPLQATLLTAPEFKPDTFPYHHTYLVPPDGKRLAPSEQDDPQFTFAASQSGAIAHHRQIVRLTLRGTTDVPVIITRIDPVVIDESDSAMGWYPICCECCGKLKIRQMATNLDCRPPSLLLASAGNRMEYSYSDSYSFKVTRTDVEQIELSATTRRGLLEWGLDIAYDAGSEQGTLRLRDPRLKVTAAAAGQEGVDPFTGETSVTLSPADAAAFDDHGPEPPCDATQ